MPIHLATDKGPLTTSDASLEDDFRDLQGNILSGHGRDHAAYAFLRFDASDRARQLLSGLAAGSVTSAFDQFAASAAFKSANKADGGIFVHIAISAKGYDLLQVSGLPSGSNPRQVSAADGYVNAFAEGMKARQSRLDDPRADDWEDAYRADVHAVVLVAGSDKAKVDAAITKLRSLVTAPAKPIGQVIAVEDGLVQRRKFPGGSSSSPGEPVEHFGFVDGISQPALLATQIEGEKEGWDPVAPPCLVLVKDPHGRGYGSFMVFRKLEQNVSEFWSAVKQLSSQLKSPPAVVGAMAVGRFENGTPVVSADQPETGTSRSNGFNYKEDANGYRCPFQAHTRKTNPRLETAPPGDVAAREQERGHRIVRRGIPYPSTPRTNFGAEPAELPQGGVGLLFTCYQSDIWEQFEFQQGAWSNDPRFLHPSPIDGWADAPAYALGTGIDAIVGQHSLESLRSAPGGPLPCNWPVAWGSRPIRTTATVSRCVTMKGGEYFFSPSISGLKSLDDGAPAISLRA